MGIGLLSSVPASAHTSRLTVHQANELYTRLAAEQRGVDADGVYGFQCVDIPLDLFKNYVGVPVYGNAIDLIQNAKAAGYEIVTPDRKPRVGDVFVMDTTYLYGHSYGHTGYIYQVNDDGTFLTVEQNIGAGSNLYYGTVATTQVRSVNDAIVGYIRLAYQK